jgi:CRISPR-associated endonuclease Cas2
MRRNFIVTYDICDPKRLRKVFKLCKGYGIHLQYSVFESATEQGLGGRQPDRMCLDEGKSRQDRCTT